MSTKKAKVQEITKEVNSIRKQPPEPRYSRAEIISAAVSFGVTPEVMSGALRLVEKSEWTRSEAEDALNKFRSREV